MPFAGGEDIGGEAGVCDRMGEDAVPEGARADHPEVESDAGQEGDLPIGPVLGGEQDRGHPE